MEHACGPAWVVDHGRLPQSALSALRSPHLPPPLCALAALRVRGAAARSAQVAQAVESILQARTAVGGPWPCAGPLPLLGSAAGHTHLTRDTTRGHRLGESSPVNSRRRRHRQSGAERIHKAVGTHMRRRRPPPQNPCAAPSHSSLCTTLPVPRAVRPDLGLHLSALSSPYSSATIGERLIR